MGHNFFPDCDTPIVNVLRGNRGIILQFSYVPNRKPNENHYSKKKENKIEIQTKENK